MAQLKTGLVSTDEAFGKSGILLEDTIKKIGWEATPFYAMIGNAAPSSRDGNVALGHQWFYDEIPDADTDENAHKEGGEMAALKRYEGSSLKNHFQIVKHAYGVTGSEAEGRRVDGKTKLGSQGEMTSIVHKKTIEKILLSETAATARVNTPGGGTAGKCGGLKSFATSLNKIEAQSQALTWQKILDLLKIGFFKGLPYSVLMMNDKQKDALDAILFEKKQATMNSDYLGVNVQTLGSTPYGSNIKIVLNPFLEQSEIIAFRPQDIFKVNWRPMKKVERVSTNDEVKKEIISEFTLRVCTPYAFAWLKDLKA